MNTDDSWRYYDPNIYIMVNGNRINCHWQVTPIALDLDRSGHVETIPGDFQFDITGNGLNEKLDGWFAPTEGILFDSTIVERPVSGKHLFGDEGGKYAHGFEKLAYKFDTNLDGLVKGDELHDLRLWIDGNSNAKLEEDELVQLSDYGIHSISLKFDEDTFISQAYLEDGSAIRVRDVFFDAHEAES